MQTLYNSDGSLAAFIPLGYSLTSRTIIAQGTTTYNVPSGTRALLVQCIAGGGAGGSGASAAVSASCGSGGGGGAYSESFITGTIAASYTVQVGAGGTPGAAGNNPGGNGTDTSFNSGAVLAKAGLGGGGGGAGVTTPTFVVGGAGGASSSGVGDVLFDGNSGGESYAPLGTVGISGDGAPGPFGGSSAGLIAENAGTAGVNYGSGGSGGCVLNGGAAKAGGAGANGVMIIWEFA